VSFHAHVVLPLAASPSPTPSPTVPDDALVSPGLLGFLSLVFLAVAVFVIWKSLNTQLRRVSFDEGDVGAPEPASDAAPTPADPPDPATPGSPE
jgi:hypothetical protein